MTCSRLLRAGLPTPEFNSAAQARAYRVTTLTRFARLAAIYVTSLKRHSPADVGRASERAVLIRHFVVAVGQVFDARIHLEVIVDPQ